MKANKYLEEVWWWKEKINKELEKLSLKEISEKINKETEQTTKMLKLRCVKRLKNLNHKIKLRYNQKMKLKKLKVDIDEIGWYMETQDRFDTEIFLDLETGEIVVVDLELLDRVDNGEPLEELTEWSEEEIKQCEEILFSDTERYVCMYSNNRFL